MTPPFPNHYGTSLHDELMGGDGDDTIDGLGGADWMWGGKGNDFYYVDNTGDQVIEYTNEGMDTVVSSVSYALTANVEYLVLTGSAYYGWGNALNNTLVAYDGTQVLDGGAGADWMGGGKGDDVYYVDNVGDQVIENFNEGNDIVSSSVNYALTANVEYLSLTGSAQYGWGNALNNNLVAYDGTQVLDGGAGADWMWGGKGDDVYYVDNAGDQVIENANEGNDTVISSVDYTLTAYVANLALTGGAIIGQGAFTGNVENLALTGGAIVGQGNDLNNTIWGTGGNNLIDGLGGDDTIDGLGGADWMWGGKGNDFYYVDNTGDQVIEYTNEGMDTVVSSVSYALTANVESLVLTGSAYYGWGNALNNTLVAYDGTQVLDGGAGADWMWGGKGDDAYFVDNTGDQVIEYTHEGMDTVVSSVSYALTANVESLVLTGSAYYGWGNALNNNLVAYDGTQVLDGGAGGDWMWGGKGNDVYYVDTTSDQAISGDKVIENANEGDDTVISSATHYTLTANVENLILTGNAEFGWGNALNNNLAAYDGTQVLDGGAGADWMWGGKGDDFYYVDNAGDQVIENANEGFDGVNSSVDYNLPANVEQLWMAGGAVIGRGNDLDNTIWGTAGDNRMDGLGGNDTMDGLAGADTMAGGAGNDWYGVDNAGDQVIENANEGDGDTVSSSVDYTLAANVENLALTGVAIVGRGNDLNNTIRGTVGNNRIDGLGGNDLIDGLAGADTMAGGAGDDWYWIDNLGDVVIENAGEGTADFAISRVYEYNLAANVEQLSMQGGAFIGRGNDLNNTIWGTAGNNLIDGLAGADTMRGGGGNDTYWVDNPGDVVTENAGEGAADGVVSSLNEYNLAANVEQLSMQGGAFIGRGNNLDNTIWGTAGNNLIDGLGGADTMRGGGGNDHYWVDNPGDVVIENAGEGTADRVVSSLYEYKLAANVEELSMEGGAFIGRGNDLNNSIWGTAGNNLIDGLGGADTMIGGGGNDHYWIDNPGDAVIEYAGEGAADFVISRVYEYNLAANVEQLSMQGGAFIGRGNDLNNTIWGTTGDNLIEGLGGNDLVYGGDGADTLWGGLGDDTIWGGTGSDTYLFARGDGADRIIEDDATVGSTDVLQFQGSISADQIWLRQLGNDLEVSVIGTSDKITIENWHAGNQYHLEQIKSSDGRTLLDGSVNNLVQAMAAFAPPGPGQTALPASYSTALAPVIAASWF